MNLYKNLIKQFSIGFFIIFCAQYVAATNTSVKVSESDITILVDESKLITVNIVGDFNENIIIDFQIQHDNIVRIIPQSIEFDVNGSRSKDVNIIGLNPGRLDITLNNTNSNVDLADSYLRVTVQHSNAIYHISYVVGWIYFVAWSVSFYPQIYINYKRKSVVGLNFDFVGLNIVGFILYSLFNVGLFFIPAIEEIYFEKYPRGLNPVQVNDIVFSLHAALATCFTIIQCFIYERANQRVSNTARAILGVFSIIILISIILAATDVITWLDFLYYCSYVKLSITLIKYIPQAYMNYKRQSTVGWSIGNIFLDFVGGMLSMLQMILNAYNYNDWVSLFGDPTKFGLGLFSVVFDIFFMIQHYVLYRNYEGYIEIDGDNSPALETEDNNINNMSEQIEVKHDSE